MAFFNTAVGWSTSVSSTLEREFILLFISIHLAHNPDQFTSPKKHPQNMMIQPCCSVHLCFTTKPLLIVFKNIVLDCSDSSLVFKMVFVKVCSLPNSGTFLGKGVMIGVNTYEIFTFIYFYL